MIADTYNVVRAAYRHAGVEQPEEAWGISWKIWLPALVGDRAEDVHRKKQEHYRKLLADEYIEFDIRMPGADMAEALIAAGHDVYFVTAASRPSAISVLRRFGLPADRLAGAELTPSARSRILIKIMDEQEDECNQHVYVDDREEGADVARAAGWRFVHMHGRSHFGGR